ncbi:hypothetical protein ACVWZD_001041 [Streptomyces sp. TE3672]
MSTATLAAFTEPYRPQFSIRPDANNHAAACRPIPLR